MNYDAIIIGFGKAGKTLAGKLGASGQKVALVEKSNEMYGGTCINVGCIPSKSLVNSSAVSAAHKDMGFEVLSEMYQKAIQKKTTLVESLRGKNYAKLANNPNITVLDGTASFVSDHTIKVKTADDELTLSSDKIFINTGSTSVIYNVKGSDECDKILYSNELMSFETLPAKLTIIGGGYIGLEYASIYSNFGSKVTIIQPGDAFLPREDRDIADSIKGILEEAGVTILTGSTITEIEKDGTIIYTKNDEEFKLPSDIILAAIGRKPNTEGLNLENTGIETGKRGEIVVDDNLRTAVDGIWAMGDVTGKQQFTYTSLDDFRIVVSQLFDDIENYSLKDRKNIPYSVFMDIPYSRVGLNENDAEKQGLNVRILTLPTAAIPKAQVLNKPQGMLKAVVDADTDKILGVMLICAESYEMINIVKLAMDFDAKASLLKNQVFTHPTMSEALNDLFSM